jgi:hypothetical protein
VTRTVDALDTSRHVREIQTARWRSMSPRQKLQLVDDLCDAVDRLARAGIQRDHPGASEHDVLWHLAARRYGVETADAAFGTRTRPQTAIE